MAANTYTEAPEVERLARSLIGEYHRHLMSERIEFVFCEKTPTKGGKETWGRARKVTGLNAFLAGQDAADDDADAFFVIEIARPVWDGINDRQRAALVDHELAHCWFEEQTDDEGNVKTIRKLLAHDLEEFSAIILRHGVWRDEVRQLLDAAEAHNGQTAMEFEDGTRVGSGAADACRNLINTMAANGGGSIEAGGKRVDIPADDKSMAAG